MSEGNIIRDDDSWLDVRVGESCTVVGRLESVGYGAPGSLIVTFVDGSSLVLEADNAAALKGFSLNDRTDVRVRAIRTEDGLKATVVMREGSVPIPLNHNTVVR